MLCLHIVVKGYVILTFSAFCHGITRKREGMCEKNVELSKLIYINIVVQEEEDHFAYLICLIWERKMEKKEISLKKNIAMDLLK